jgi:hypothetical protein
MTSRERFEAHFKKEFPRAELSWQPLMAVYATSQVEVAWSIWQAAERQALERAAAMLDKLADDFAGEYGHDDMGALSFGVGSHAYEKMDRYTDMKDYAEAIRALNESKKENGDERPLDVC